ncbi:unnamed protein product [Medioppia subpectinata]|uniref:Uncharacterized protein n=1 Tax=Medioppia subpectinata TaxID=1979941 RepID=A0A7R9L4B6_9ACAR|nr:unnamed protein product [Medioppia subpectinata]CAG2115082.1 unnamed protein product [Medioppia subpectinata]
MADTSGPLNFGPDCQIADKTSPLFAFMRNILFDIALRPDATALNPHAYDQLADKWDPNGPEVPTYYHSIHRELSCLKWLTDRSVSPFDMMLMFLTPASVLRGRQLRSRLTGTTIV